MKYIIETDYPKNTFFAKRIFTPGWYGTEPYFNMGLPATDGVGTQHVALRIHIAKDDEIVGNIIGRAHVPAKHTMVSYDDLQNVTDAINDNNIEKALEMLKWMRFEDNRRYQPRVKSTCQKEEK